MDSSWQKWQVCAEKHKKGNLGMDDLNYKPMTWTLNNCQLHDIRGIWGDIIVMTIWRVV